jgi:hypothetical protein
MSTRVCEVAITVQLPLLPEARTVMETATRNRIAGKKAVLKLEKVQVSRL